MPLHDYAPGGPLGSVIGDVTLTAAAGSIDIQGLSQVFANLRIVCSLRSVAAADADDTNLRFNNDSGANYDFFGMDLGQTNLNSTSQTSGRVITVPGNNPAAGVFGIAVIDVADYTSASKYKPYIATGGNTGSATLRFKVLNGLWKSTSPITRFTIFGGSNFAIGSRVTVYGA